MQAVNAGVADGLLPAVGGQARAAIAVGFAILEAALGAECLDFSGREQRGHGLLFRFLARIQRGGDPVRQPHQRNAHDQYRHHHFDERKSGLVERRIHLSFFIRAWVRSSGRAP